MDTVEAITGRQHIAVPARRFAEDLASGYKDARQAGRFSRAVSRSAGMCCERYSFEMGVTGSWLQARRVARRLDRCRLIADKVSA